MVRNAFERDFRLSKMAAGGNLAEKINKSCVLIRNSEIVDRNWFSVIQNGHKATSLVEAIYRDACTLISVNYSEIRYLVYNDQPKLKIWTLRDLKTSEKGGLKDLKRVFGKFEIRGLKDAYCQAWVLNC